MIVYNKLWALMSEKRVSQYLMIKQYGFSPAQITRLKRNQSVTTHTIGRLCKMLNCRVDQIMEYVER